MRWISILHRGAIGLFLGVTVGIVIFSATQYQWNHPPLQSALLQKYCCYPEGPTCSTLPVPCDAKNSFENYGACTASCKRPIFLCKNKQTQSAVCNEGTLDMENVILGDGEPPPFYVKSECENYCLPPASAAASSLSGTQGGFCCKPATGECSALR